MLAASDPRSSGDRTGEIQGALRLVTVSVVFGLASGAVSVVSGLSGHSLGVLAVGLGVLADVTGSATLIWRFRAELREPAASVRRERQSTAVVALALAVVAVVLMAESVSALAQGSHPSASLLTMTAAAISLVVLTPLAAAKHRLGVRLGSRALHGDGALSGIGAATSFLALAGLIGYQLLGWWWADRVAALVVAAVAAVAAWRTARGHRAGTVLESARSRKTPRSRPAGLR
jgi:divalent metal cation (Fe/Co/Zn/Cd) transporter